MDYGLYRYDEPYSRPARRRINYFAWTVVILLLTGFAFAAWLGSFYIFSQPERPDSYRILQKLHKVEPAKRFEHTAEPGGEFLSAKQPYDRYNAMGSAEFVKTNAELARNYIRNFQRVPGLVPYIVGRYVIEETRELSSSDLFTSGMVALTDSVENPELLMEHLYPSDPKTVRLIKQTLTTGLELKLDRAHDLSAVIHVERFNDGRIMLTAVPLLYGTYTVMRGTGTFSLEPPLSLNLEAGWPLFKEQSRLRAEMRYAQFKQGRQQPQAAPQVAIPGFAPSGTPPSPANRRRKHPLSPQHRRRWSRRKPRRRLLLRRRPLRRILRRHQLRQNHSRRKLLRRKLLLLRRSKLRSVGSQFNPAPTTSAHWRQQPALEIGRPSRLGKCRSGD